MKKQISKHKKKLISLILMVAMIIGTAVLVLAKYYATTNNKGVAVASGLYFGSNILSTVEGDITLDNVKEESDLPIYLNPKVWSGASYTYPVEIRNYDSVLLYNDANLDIEYTVEFILLSDESSTSYSVKQIKADGTTDIEREINTQRVVKYTSKIKGGQPLYDKYEVTIHIENEANFAGKSAPVLVLAYPTAPDYIAATAKELRLVSIIQGDYTQPKIEIDNQGFVIENYMNSSNWLNIVNQYSGYEYNITTTGDIANSNTENITQSIAVTWNSQVLSVDNFNQYYKKALQNNKITDNNDGTSTMIIDAMPYANIAITFYKKSENYNFSTLGSMDEFKNLVNAEIVEN